MIKVLRFLTPALMILILAGCAPAKLDTSSEEAAKVSIERITSSLSEGEQLQFGAAIQASLVEAAFSGKGAGINTALSQYNGKTGKEIIAQHQSRMAELAAERAAKQAKQKADLENQLSELMAAQQGRVLALEKLKLIAMDEAKIIERPSSFMREHEFIATISNQSDVTLTAIKFNFRVISPNREVPWNKGEGLFFLKGGLEPGEVRKESSSGSGLAGFILAAKAMTEHPEAVLEWAVIDAYGVDEKSILPDDRSEEIERIKRQLNAVLDASK